MPLELTSFVSNWDNKLIQSNNQMDRGSGPAVDIPQQQQQQQQSQSAQHDCEIRQKQKIKTKK